MILIIDTETTGLPDFSLPVDHPSQPHIVQIAAWLGEWDVAVVDDNTVGLLPTLRYIASLNSVIRPDGWTVGAGALAVHGITTQYAHSFGEDLTAVLARLYALVADAAQRHDGCSGTLVAHNLPFDHRMLLRDSAHCDVDALSLSSLRPFCTMRALTPRMRLPSRHPGQYKWPSLAEAYEFCFGRPSEASGRHSAMGDVISCRDIYEHGVRQEWWK